MKHFLLACSLFLAIPTFAETTFTPQPEKNAVSFGDQYDWKKKGQNAAEKIADKCYHQNFPKESFISTVELRKFNQAYNQCLRKEIINNINIFCQDPKSEYARNGISTPDCINQMTQAVDNIEQNTNQFYGTLYNTRNNGTSGQVYPAERCAEVLNNMLEDLLAQMYFEEVLWKW